MSLQGQVAIVTGGSKGWGAGIAEALRRAGAEVWITGRNEEALRETAERLGVQAFRADAASADDWDTLFAAVLDRHGRVDILVNNAGGGGQIAPMAEQTDANIEATIAINLTSALLGCRRAAEIMKARQSGAIVNISSGCAVHAWPGWGVYSAAKAGMVQFSKCLYTELRPLGVRVTLIIPYWGATDFVASAHIEGHPAGDPEVRKVCIQTGEMGDLVRYICEMPGHLAIPEITFMPLVQEVVPM